MAKHTAQYHEVITENTLGWRGGGGVGYNWYFTYFLACKYLCKLCSYFLMAKLWTTMYFFLLPFVFRRKVCTLTLMLSTHYCYEVKCNTPSSCFMDQGVLNNASSQSKIKMCIFSLFLMFAIFWSFKILKISSPLLGNLLDLLVTTDVTFWCSR